ncbi:MAG: hypothetical protein NT096_10980 [Proteobacteria bacterium]|nr:hypothetical protein [Pseudomonadota bacterium]
MKNIKLSLPIFLINILLTTGMVYASTLTPVGTCNGQNKIDITLNVDDVTGIVNYDITVIGTGLTTATADVSKTGSIAVNWTVFDVSAVTGGIRIIADSGTGSGSTGAGNLGTITFTATDGTIDTETVSVVVNNVTTGVILTPADYVPVSCTTCYSCSMWNDVITKYNAYEAGVATWTDVIYCYVQYASPNTLVNGC